MDNTGECPSVRVRNTVEGIENLLKKDYVFVCYSPVLDTFFSALLRKKLELTVPQCLSGIGFPLSFVRMRNEVERIENFFEKQHSFVCYSPVLNTFFSALLRKKLELTGM
ncbi:hypothetical protein [uncultured Chryseobacterium sp.]|uniref:hypothetical protein n=1 Tax=uncultured Chryseobacterium sp. TaxID=259322 RepID=UPI0025DF867D|nr:hypothetical protein [uncultured Chryseobacterium sp.]